LLVDVRTIGEPLRQVFLHFDSVEVGR
jgi:hypothetical protein